MNRGEQKETPTLETPGLGKGQLDTDSTSTANVIQGGFSPAQWLTTPIIDPPEVQLANEMHSYGITPPPEIVMDGEIHRFPTNGNGADDAGWYVVFSDGIPAGAFGDWRKDLTVNFRSNSGQTLSSYEETEYRRKISEAEAKRKVADIERHSKAAEECKRFWNTLIPASESNPYLSRKKVGPHFAKADGDTLVVPVLDVDGEIRSLQYITTDGTKRFHKGSTVSGCFSVFGNIGTSATIFLTEGFATGATVFETSGVCTAVAFSAGGISAAASILREKYPSKRLIIVADNDQSGTGIEAARKAADATGSSIVIPPETGDANDYKLAGGDLAVLLSTAVEIVDKHYTFRPLAEIQTADLPPRTWYTFFTPGFNLVTARKGIGKSYFVLDAGNAIAGGEPFLDRPTPKAKVLYVPFELDEIALHERTAGRNLSPDLYVSMGWRQGHKGLEDARQAIVEDGFRVLIFDMFLPLIDTATKLDDYRASEEFRRWRMLGLETGAAIVAVWHSGKADRDDFMLSALGTTGLPGQSDSILALTRGRHSTEVKLNVGGNHGKEECLELKFENTRWTSLGEVPLYERRSALDLQMINAVERYPAGVKYSVIADEENRKHEATRKKLDRLSKDGLISKLNGLYYPVRQGAPWT